MSRIKAVMQQLEANNKKALIPFVTSGDPDMETTLALLHAMVEKGADIIEVGIPFSDPMADGPVIQKANERALKNGSSLKKTFAMIETFRKTNQTMPIVLMGYLNPLEFYGYEAFAAECSRVGVDGLILVDLPPEESEEIVPVLKKNELDLIYLVTPTSSEKRKQKISQAASGYLYYVSLKGVTGAGQGLDLEEISANVEELKERSNLPVVVGFGIKDQKTAQQVSAIADGVVVGSAIVSLIEENKDKGASEICSQVSSLIGDLRVGADNA